MIGTAFIVIAIGIIFRMIGIFFLPPIKKYKMKERIFLCVSWLPKAAVQVFILLFYFYFITINWQYLFIDLQLFIFLADLHLILLI